MQLIAAQAWAEDVLPSNEAGELFDWLALAMPQDREYLQFSTRDPERETFPNLDRDNKDFNNFLAVCGERPRVYLQTESRRRCDRGLGGYLLAADDSGPGIVSRIWFAVGGNQFTSERIRIYADDLDSPVYDAPLSEWRAGAADPFVMPLAGWTSNAVVSYVPIAYQRRLRVLIDDLSTSGYYYNQTNIQRGQDSGRGVTVLSAEDLARVEQQVHAATGSELEVEGAWTVAAKQAVQLLDRAGAGMITQIRLTLPALEPRALHALTLRMRWEHSQDPAVELPLSAFFGAELEVAAYRTLPLVVERDGEELTLEANWPMPHFTHAEITLENAGDTEQRVSARIRVLKQPPAPEVGHFHATYHHSQGPFQDGDRYGVATVHGHGKYVGTMVFMQGKLDADSFAHYPLGFLEGDERVVIDGHTVIAGTGTEDFFDAGYYWGSGRFKAPFATLISLSQDSANGTGSATAARWHVLTNSIEFDKSLDFSFEYGANRPRSATDYASVAYYYLFN